MRPRHNEYAAVISGIMTTLTAIGLARFAYTPLIPALIENDWFSPSQAAYLGATNLLGYLLGALSAHWLSERFRADNVITWSFIAITGSFLFCAYPTDFSWFLLWRLIAGIAGAWLMVISPSLVLSATPMALRARTGTLMFCGIGIGVLLPATLIPLLLNISLSFTWLALGILSALAGLLYRWMWQRLPTNDLVITPTRELQTAPSSPFGHPAVWLVIGAYAMDAAGFIPHSVFWADYLSRELGLGNLAAAMQWGTLGTGAILGPFISAWLVKRFGWHISLLIAFMLKTVAIALPFFSSHLFYLTLSSLTVGAMIPGLVALTSGRLAELLGLSSHKQAWGLATSAFAATQAISGYLFSSLYSDWGSYRLLFPLGSLLMLSGFLAIAASAYIRSPQPASSTGKH